MGTITISRFGKIEHKAASNLNEDMHWDVCDTEVQLVTRKIKVNLWTDRNEGLDESLYLMVSTILDNLEHYDTQAREKLLEDFVSKDSEYVQEYISYHETECGINSRDAFNQILLRRVGFYPQCEDMYAVFDYSFDRNITDLILVVNFDHNGVFSSMCCES